MAETKKKNTRKPKEVKTDVPVLENDIVETVKAEETVVVEKEDRFVKVFMKKNVFLPNLQPLYTHIRYEVPESRLPEFPENSYVLI